MKLCAASAVRFVSSFVVADSFVPLRRSDSKSPTSCSCLRRPLDGVLFAINNQGVIFMEVFLEFSGTLKRADKGMNRITKRCF